MPAKFNPDCSGFDEIIVVQSKCNDRYLARGGHSNHVSSAIAPDKVICPRLSSGIE